MEKSKLHYSWLIFVGCCVMSFVGLGLIINTQGLFFTPVGKDLGFTRTQIALMLTIQNITQMITMPIAGKMFPKYNAKVLLTGSFLVFAGAIIACSTFNNLYMFYAAGIVMGIVQPFCVSLVLPIFLGNWFEKKLGLALGIAAALSGLGGTIFNPVVSNIILTYGWRKAYIFIGVIALILVLPFTLFVMVFKPADKGLYPYGVDPSQIKADKQLEESGVTAKEAYKSAPFYLFCIAMVVLQMVGGIVQHVSAHIVNIGYSLNVGATVVSGIMLGAATGKFIIGFLLDKWSSKLVTCIYATIGFVGWLGLNVALNQQVMVASGFVIGIAQALVLVALPFFVKKAFGTREYSAIISTMSLLGALASAASVYIGGAFFDATGSYRIPLSLNSAYFAIALITICIATASKKKTVVELEVNN
ncbi:MFS transporter [Clostridium sp. BL-8]|uniref:MFS transporter n=1 Tax=Clostridium sp. BL-8 TaxID=349938 RepID=UPI00098CB8EE|nr:MFS transporter [Clostridium sp. BL-8]OOM77492.1 putative MFS-type transporter YhjX [Clostridium sp. BL-8]